MNKLNRTELKVLASKIQQELHNAIREAQKESDEKYDVINQLEAETAFNEIHQLGPVAQKVFKGRYGDISKLTVENILASMRPVQTKVKNLNYYNNQDIFDALVIGQISSPDMESLCNAVAAQFINP